MAQKITKEKIFGSIYQKKEKNKIKNIGKTIFCVKKEMFVHCLCTNRFCRNLRRFLM